MQAYIARTPIGVFAFTDDGQILAKKPARTPSDALFIVRSNDNPFVSELTGFEFEESEASYKIFRRQFRKIALEIFETDKKVNLHMNEFGKLLSSSRLSTAVTKDKLLIQASCASDDLSKMVNIYLERLWEWYSLHYPEANRKELVENVAKFGNRRNFPKFTSSLGIDLTDQDEKILRYYASMIMTCQDGKKKLDKYVEDKCREIMPNFSSLIDPALAARFLSLAGSLEKLARMPASTIQLLGAEKSLFRHLKQQGKSPKYGILFQDGRIQSAPDSKRGKAARVISSKLMQAAKIDFYSQRFEPKLRQDLDTELSRI
jgi:nucleolar protein 56